MINLYTDRNENWREGNIGFFLELAVDNYINAKVSYVEARDYQSQFGKPDPLDVETFPDIEWLLRRQDEYFKFCIQGIVNLTIFYEAFINEVGMISLGSTYFRDHLDRLSILSKWELVLRLIFNTKLDNSQAWYNAMCRVISSRNKIVHYKTKISSGADAWPEYGETLELGIKGLIPLREYLTLLDPARDHLPLSEYIVEILLMHDKHTDQLLQ